MQYWSTLDHSIQVQLENHFTITTYFDFLIMMVILILIYKQSSNSMYSGLPGMVQGQSMI